MCAREWVWDGEYMYTSSNRSSYHGGDALTLHFKLDEWDATERGRLHVTKRISLAWMCACVRATGLCRNAYNSTCIAAM